MSVKKYFSKFFKQNGTSATIRNMEIDNNKTKDKIKKNLAEDSFRISISDFGKKLLYPANIKEMDNLDYLLNKEAGTLKGKEESFNIQNGSDSLYVSFRVELNKTPKTLELSFKKKADSLEERNQSIELEEDIATFGIRFFFRCSCGRKSTVFYLPKEEYSFKCRECAKIIYESQTINRNTMGGLFWYMHRMLKLAKRQEGIKRMFYGDKRTKKNQRFTDLLNEWNNEINKEAMIKAGKFSQFI